MINSYSNNAFDIIDSFSQLLNATIKKGYGFSILQVNNHLAKGRISAFQIFSGFSCITYDITFSDSFEFTLKNSTSSTVYFVYCLCGQFDYQFGGRNAMHTVNTQQNVIVLDKNNIENRIILPGGTKLKISFIYITEEDLQQNKLSQSTYLQTYLSDIFTQLEHKENYQFFGRIRPITAEYVRILIDNRKSGLPGRLITESTLFQILLTQLEDHDEEINNPQISSALSRKEINKIINLSESISQKLEQNLGIEKLCSLSGLTPRKLQMGFRQLYGMTVSRFITKARLERSRELIETTKLTVSEIVYSIGLSSRSYFSKIFKEMYTISPNEYKKLYALQNAIRTNNHQ
ncbi:helix-turn-helix transcriptional regulator [Aquimarina sp. U1-2]|uniref:helix-turn-helix domain-containing protein n=1 Tax=Aquimarina sp. U1-2 TaxID=2823141 RepID=UPI001AECE6CA|nr:AraC family transcriptional regulator [Aquimarina sp. U1-2]MBP2833686.1 helix-turn-helix transcriptional regulator [Aquimarina sp. U1-2]